jgi:integrase
LHPDVVAAIAATPSEHLTFLTTAHGKPFSGGGFTRWFREECEAAGIRGFSVHGLRKAACRRLAEAGCTEKQIAAISGHRTLAEVARYTMAAEQPTLARAGMDKMRTPTVKHAYPDCQTVAYGTENKGK